MTLDAIVSRASLSAAASVAARVAEKRNSIPILSNLRIRATEFGSLAISGTDLDRVASMHIDGVADTGFDVTLPAHMLADMAKKSTCEYVSLYFDMSAAKVTLDFDEQRASFNTLPAADFPILESGALMHSFTLPRADLVGLFSAVAFCMSSEETRYYLNGVYLHVVNDIRDGIRIRAVATDGHKMGMANVAAPTGCPAFPSVIVPASTVNDLVKLFPVKVKRGADAPPPVTVEFLGEGTKMRIAFESGPVRIVSKLVDGTFPDYARVVPVGNEKVLKVDASDLLAGIAQVTALSSERGKAVKLTLAERGSIRLDVSNPDSGTASASVGADFTGDPLTIGFNSSYLTAVLKAVGENATMKLAGAGSPTLISGDGAASYVLMPMRV